jgi:hypothetical protein
MATTTTTNLPAECPECGQPAGQCYNLCPNSASFYSPERERADAGIAGFAPRFDDGDSYDDDYRDFDTDVELADFDLS